MSLRFAVGVMITARLGYLAHWRHADGPRVLDLRLLAPSDGVAAALEALGHAPGDWVVVAASRAAELPASVSEPVYWRSPLCAAGAVADALRARPGSLFVTRAEQAENLSPRRVLLSGYEAAGIVGEESTSVLLRRTLRATSAPVYVVGGLGPDTAAGAIAAGAAGVILAEVLWACPEAGADEHLLALLERFDPSDTATLGRYFDFALRTFRQVATRPPKAYEDVELAARGEADAARRCWLDLLLRLPFGFVPERVDSRTHLVLLGQLSALAPALRDHFGHADAVVAHYRATIERNLAGIAADNPLCEGARLAERFGTRFPLFQGPMSQVADVPTFVDAIGASGAFPWLAFSNTPDYIVGPLLADVRALMGDRPWGVGIIGMDSNRYRDAHIELLLASPPPWVMVAAGTLEQALTFQSRGIGTVLHTPVPTLLRGALQAGLRHFVLEGAEAGGHVGKLGLVALVQYAVEVVSEAIAEGVDPESISLVVAGGISDVASAHLAAASLYRLHERGVAVGLQMGTAYLLTEEAVASGALSPVFQEMALASRGTRLLGQTVNTPTRVLCSVAADNVRDNEDERLRADVPLRVRKEHYEDDNFGGLRAAAKAESIEFTDETRKHTRLVPISADVQRETGLFHAGQTVALLDEVRPALALNLELTARYGAAPRDAAGTTSQRESSMSNRHPDPNARSGTQPAPAPRPLRARAALAAPAPAPALEPDLDDAIAIIGIGAKVPGALDNDTFWRNILERRTSISDVPVDVWDPALYWDPDPTVPDKTYSRIGGFVRGFELDRKRYRIPPRTLDSIDPTQQLALAATADALADAGLVERDFDRSRCAVVVGNSLGGDLREYTELRVHFPRLAGALLDAARGEDLDPALVERLLAHTERVFKASLPEITEDSMPGELANVVAGRIANAFDLTGPSFITDAACASSLAAIDAAVRGLRSGAYDYAVSGGSDRCMSPATYTKFAKIGALSPDGSRPFDIGANGFVMGEGAVIFVLRRLRDAIADGDRVYAVIRGVGGGSDGRGKGITAPNPEGQLRALRAAYRDAGVSPATIGLLEAHGTSTRVGDVVEANTFGALFEGEQADRPIALGSVKSNIGHLKAAAGAAGLFKAAMALHHGVLPPTCGFEAPNPKIDYDRAPLRVQTELETWPVGEHPRRAGVSGFGFGGTNFHVVLEEYEPRRAQPTRDGASRSTGSGARGAAQGVSLARTYVPGPEALADLDAAIAQAREEAASGVPRARRAQAPAQTLAQAPGSPAPRAVPAVSGPAKAAAIGIAAATEAALADALEAVLDALRERPEATYARLQLPREGETGRYRLAVAAADAAEALPLLERALNTLRAGRSFRIVENQGVYFRDLEAVPAGQTAFLFTGQGSQYLRMGADLRDAFPEIDAAFAQSDALLAGHFARPLSDYVFGHEPGDEAAFVALSQTEITQPAVLTLDAALYRILTRFGLRADAVAGHSLGEYGACFAAGVLSVDDAIRTVAVRGTAMAQAQPLEGDKGAMASVPLPAAEVAPLIERWGGRVVIANKNSPKQTIIAGYTAEMAEATAWFDAQDIETTRLPVSHAFHTDIVSPASAPLREFLATLPVSAPHTPIITNVDATPYPDDVEAIRDLLSVQLARPVEWDATIERMYADGVRTFVEVGPKRALSGFVADILADRPHQAYHSNHPKLGGPLSLGRLIGALWADGVLAPAVVERSLPVAAAVATTEAAAAPPAGGMLAWASKALAASAPRATAPSASQVAPARVEERAEVSEVEVDVEVEVAAAPVADDAAEAPAKPAPMGGMLAWASKALAASAPRAAAPPEAVAKPNPAPNPAPEPEPAKPASLLSMLSFSLPPEPSASNGASRVARVDLAGVDAYEVLLEELCARTGYGPSEVEPDFELEADLGIDTVKQAEILTEVQERFGIAPDESFRLADYPTPRALADYIERRLSAQRGATEVVAVAAVPVSAPVEVTSAAPAEGAAYAALLDALCEKTGYDRDEIQPDFELEADLGVDTVKQAEIMAAVRERFELARDESFRLADYPTLADLAGYVEARLAAQHGATEVLAAPVVTPEDPVPAPAVAAAPAAAPAPAATGIAYEALLDALCEKTGYDRDEIQPDFELEADLGVDTVKQAEIMAAVRERFELARDESFRLADYPTLADLAGYVEARLAAQLGATEVLAVPVEVPEVAPAASAPVAAAPAAAAPAPVVAPAPVIAVAPGVAYEALLDALCEKTGYDRDEIQPDFELEADLGVDTVKQAEIMAAVRERFELARDESFRLADYPTLADLAGYVEARLSAQHGATEVLATPVVAPAASAPAPAIAPAPTPAPAPALAVAPGVAYEALLDALCEKTGYDRDEIQPDFELEADLGVDTVKQAEIMAAVRERFELARDESFRLADYPTLADLAGYVEARLTAQLGATEVLAVPEPAPAPAPAPAPGRAADAPFAPRAVVAAPAELVPTDVAALQALFRGRAVGLFDVDRCHRIALSAALATLGARAFVVDGEDAEAIAASLAAGASGQHLGLVIGSGAGLADPSLAAHRVFSALRALGERTRAAQRAEVPVLGLTRCGGSLGLDGGGGASAGVATGMLKGLAREWDSARVRLIDLADERADEGYGMSVLAQAFLGAELESGLAYGERRVPALAAQLPEAPRPVALRRGDVVVLTGGGRGVTARVALALARRHGVRVALLGRTDISAAEGGVDLETAKQQARAELSAQHERVTPAMVRERLLPLERALEVAENLAALRAAGGDALYVTCDVTDRRSVSEALSQVLARFGRVDAVIHGAGVERSKALDDKTAAEAVRVVETKVGGAANLLWALRHQPLRAFVCFGSVVGRYGNAGQVDYAGANDALAKLTCRLRHQRPELLAVTIDWTGWDEVGMAVNSGTAGFMQERGIELLPADLGAERCAEIIAEGWQGEVLLAGAIGDLAQAPGASRAHAHAHAHARAGSGAQPAAHATERHPTSGRAAIGAAPRRDLLDSVEVLDGATAAVASVLLEAVEPYLDHHRIDGTPVLPGVMGIELAAQLCRHIAGDKAFRGVDGWRFDRPVKLHRDEPVQLILSAQRVEAQPDGTVLFDVALRSVRAARTGKALESEHFAGRVRFGGPGEGPRSPLYLDLSGDVRRGFGASIIYDHYFHTGPFALLDELVGVSEQLAVGEGRVSSAPLSPLCETLLTDPLVTELAFQVGGLQGLALRKTMLLPARIGRSALLEPALAGERLTARVAICEVNEQGVRFDAEVVTDDGRAVARYADIELIAVGPVETRGIDRGPLDIVVDRRSHEEIDGAAFDAPHSLAAPGELEAYERKRSDDAKRDWVVSRALIKGALRDFYRRFYGIALDAQEIELAKDQHGAPSVRVHRHVGPTVRPPHISLSHSGGRALIAIVPPWRRAWAGVDLERVESRSDGFLANYFTDGEQAMVRAANGSRDTLATAIWSLKEAASKSLGLGTYLDLRNEIEVVHIGERAATLRFQGRALEQVEKMGATVSRAEWALRDGFTAASVELDKHVSAPPDTALASVMALLLHCGRS